MSFTDDFFKELEKELAKQKKKKGASTANSTRSYDVYNPNEDPHAESIIRSSGERNRYDNDDFTEEFFEELYNYATTYKGDKKAEYDSALGSRKFGSSKPKEEDAPTVGGGSLMKNGFMPPDSDRETSQEERKHGGGGGNWETGERYRSENNGRGGLDIFQKGPFKDGYDFGDVTKAILGTAGDTGLNVVKGFTSIVEGFGDTISYGVADVADWAGEDEWADDVRAEAKKDFWNGILEPADDFLEKYSLFGETTDSIAQGLGQAGTLIGLGGFGAGAGLGTAGTTAITSGTMFTSSYGNGVSEALRSGATAEEARTYGLIAGASDTISEMLWGGLGKGVNAVGISKGLSSIDDVAAKKLSNAFKNEFTKNWSELFVKAGFEGAEEVIAAVGQAAGKSITYMSEEDFWEILEDENLLEQFVVGAVTSGMTQSGYIPGTSQGSLKESNQTGRDFITGLTANEQAVIDKEVEKRIEEAEKDGTKLSNKDKNKIVEQVKADLDKGRISTGTIEAVLGGDDYTAFSEAVKGFDGNETYKAYKDAIAEEKAWQDEFDALKDVNSTGATLGQTDRFNDLKKRLEGTRRSSELRAQLEPEIQRINGLQSKLRQSVIDKSGSERLRESYRELQRSTEKYQGDVSKYKSEAARKTIRNLIDGGIANNTNEFKEFADLLAQISEDKGVVFDLTDNKKLKGTRFEVKGATVNAFVTDDGYIAINNDSKKKLNSLVGHEITHVLEGTEFYEHLQKAVQEYATKKGEWDTRLANITELYKKHKPDADPVKELTADLVGDYVFDDYDFVYNLATKHPTGFKAIWEEIKYLAKVATTGSKEARALEKAKHAFAKAWRETGNIQKNTVQKNGAQYDITALEDGRVYVTASRKVINGTTKAEQRKEISNFFSELLQDNPSIDIHTIEGDVLTISKAETAHKARDDYKTVDGKPVQMTDEEFSVKLNVEAHIDEVAEVSKKIGNSPDGKNHGFAKDGFTYRRAYFEDFDGQYYEVTLSIGHDGTVATVYNVGKIKESVPPSAKVIAVVGSQPLGGTHSKNSISQNSEKSSGSVKNSFSEQEAQETNDTLKDVGLELDSQSETVSYSLSSLEETFNIQKEGHGNPVYGDDYIKAREEYVSALAKSIAEDKGNPTQEEIEKADRYLDGLFLVHDMIAADRDRLDYEAAVDKSAWVSNAEYGGSIDFSTLCAKRRLFTGTFDAIQEALPDTVLNENDFLRIRNMLLEKELESPCSMCYVEGSRAKHGEYVAKFLKDYLATNPEWKPQIADFTSSTRLEQTRINHPEAYQAYQTAMNKLAQRKPKEASVRTDYKGEILVAFEDGTSVEIKNKNGGIRFNSFSDFEIIHALDAMQVITDMARVGLNGQAYTKVKEFAECFGNTGLKINLSLVAKDVDANGKLIYDEVNGMKYAEAMDIRNRYSENVGSVIVVFNEDQLKAALADPEIDYVLPFHRSQWKKSQYTMMGLPVKTKDYTQVQNDRIRNPKTGRPVKLSKLKQTTTYTNDITGETFVIKDNIMPNQYWDFSRSGRENAQRYLDYINANGMTPKFDSVLEKVDGRWVLPEGAVGDGYYKLLIDFKMYDNDGWGAPQNPVVPEFNMPYIQQMLNDYKGGHKAFPVAHDVVDEFVEGKKNGQFSLSEEGEAPQRGGGYSVYGDNIRVKDPSELGFAPIAEDVAPIREDIAPVREPTAITQETPQELFPDDYAPLTEEETAARQSEILDGITDEDAPPEMDAPYYGEEEASSPADPFENRDIKEVGNRKVKAYMYENPEVKPFFQEEANIMLGELNDTVKGERIYTETDLGSVWTGTSRYTSDDIAYLRDSLGYSYADIEKGLNAIIEDNGKENIAVAKRIEFILNDRLAKGYTDFRTGMEIPANQDYVNLLNEKQIAEYTNEARQQYFEASDQLAPPMEEDIAPIAESAQETMPAEEVAPVADKPIQTVKDRLEAKLHSLQAELESNGRLREESKQNYDNEIARLEAEYAARKNKNTKAANDLLRRIERTRRFKDSVDADYAKRISDLEARVTSVGDELRSGQSPTEQRAMRGELHKQIIDNAKTRFAENGLDFDEVLKNAKDLSTIATVDNTPQRVMEKSLGYKEGQILSDITVNKVAQNETEAIKWLNSFTNKKDGLLAKISKQYGIKPGSKESAAAQMYAEGFYVGKDNSVIQYGDAELAKDFPDAKVRENIKGLAKDQRIRQIYDETLSKINESRARNAYPEIPKLDNYFLHFRAMEDTFSRLGLPFNPNDIKAKDLPTDLNGVTADLKPGQPYFASAMHRRGQRTSFDLLGGLEKYLSSAKNQIYHIDDIQTLRALRNYIADTYGQANGLEGLDALDEDAAQEKIKQVYGSHLSTFAKFLNEEANVIAGKTALIDRGLEGIVGRRAMAFMDTVNRQVGSNMVGYNVSSALTNLIAPVQAFAKTNKLDFIKGFAQLTSNKIKSIQGKGDGFAEESPVMIRRKGEERFHRTAWQKMSDPGYALMGAVDNFSTELIARAKYNELTRKGMDSETAHIETDKWVSRLMGDRSIGQMPQLYNSKMLGLVTKFQLEVRNQLDSQFYDTIKEAGASTEDIQNGLARNAKKAAKIGSTFFTLAVGQHIFGKVFESIAGYNPAFDIISAIAKALGWDDDDESEDTFLDNLEQGFFELMGDLPYTSVLEGGRIPISSALPIQELFTGKDQYGNEVDENPILARIKTAGKALPYYLLPGGYGQIKKTTQGLEMFDDDLPISGSYTDKGKLRFPVEDTLEEMFRAGIFGQYASSNARDYFDNERLPLDEKQTQEFVDSGISIQEYWDYREGLKGLKTLNEKADYIYGLDLPIEAKNLFINNLADREEAIDLSGMDGYKNFQEFDFATKNPELHEFLKSIDVNYDQYMASDDFTKDAYTWAYKNPEKYTLSKAVASDVVTYRTYASELYDIKADKDEDGKSISGSRKEKVLDYINNLDADYGEKIILFKSEYPADDTYNYDIIDYLNSRADISYEEMNTILRELGFKIASDGITITWD